MSTKATIPIVKITPGQLLLIDPNAYINLIHLFPIPEGVKTWEDLPAFELPLDYQLAMVAPKDVILICKKPPHIMRFDRSKMEWVPTV